MFLYYLGRENLKKGSGRAEAADGLWPAAGDEDDVELSECVGEDVTDASKPSLSWRRNTNERRG